MWIFNFLEGEEGSRSYLGREKRAGPHFLVKWTVPTPRWLMHQIQKSSHIPLSSTNLIIQSVKVKSVKHSLRRDWILIHKDHNFLIFLLSTHKMKISTGEKKKVYNQAPRPTQQILAEIPLNCMNDSNR